MAMHSTTTRPAHTPPAAHGPSASLDGFGPLPLTFFCSERRERALLIPGNDRQDAVIEIPGRCARLLKVLIDAREHDRPGSSAYPGWRTRQRLATLLGVSEESVTRYASKLVALVEAGLQRALGVPPSGQVIERQRGVGMRAGLAFEFVVFDLEGNREPPESRNDGPLS